MRLLSNCICSAKSSKLCEGWCNRDNKQLSRRVGCDLGNTSRLRRHTFLSARSRSSGMGWFGCGNKCPRMTKEFGNLLVYQRPLHVKRWATSSAVNFSSLKTFVPSCKSWTRRRSSKVVCVVTLVGNGIGLFRRNHVATTKSRRPHVRFGCCEEPSHSAHVVCHFGCFALCPRSKCSSESPIQCSIARPALCGRCLGSLHLCVSIVCCRCRLLCLCP